MAVQTRVLASLLVLVAGIVASVYLALELMERGGGEPEEHAEQALTLLVPFPLEEVAAVEIVLRGALHRFERDASGAWLYHAHQHAPADAGSHRHSADPARSEAIASALAMFSRTRIEREIAADRAEAARYGVDLPPVIVMLYGPGEARPRLRLHAGDVAPDGFSRYVLLAESGAIVTIPDYQIRNLADLVGSLINASSP